MVSWSKVTAIDAWMTGDAAVRIWGTDELGRDWGAGVTGSFDKLRMSGLLRSGGGTGWDCGSQRGAGVTGGVSALGGGGTGWDCASQREACVLGGAARVAVGVQSMRFRRRPLGCMSRFSLLRGCAGGLAYRRKRSSGEQRDGRANQANGLCTWTVMPWRIAGAITWGCGVCQVGTGWTQGRVCVAHEISYGCR